MVECDSCGGSGADMPDVIPGRDLLKGQFDSCKVCGGSGWIKSSESENNMNDKKRSWQGVDPADPTTESISGITLPTRGSHATNPFQKPGNRLFVAVSNQVIQEKSGLNFFVFTKREMHGTERLVEDRDLAAVLADKLEERRELKLLLRDAYMYIQHAQGCAKNYDNDCDCGAQEIKKRAWTIYNELRKEEDDEDE